MSDKYEKRGMEWCPDELDHEYHTDKHPCKAVAQALREAAAEAYEDAGKIMNDRAEGFPRNDFRPTCASDIEGWADDFTDKAKALRSSDKGAAKEQK